MRANPADQHVVSVKNQVVRGDARCQTIGTVSHILRSITGGDVFHCHAQFWQPTAQGVEHGINEDLFAIENIDTVRGDFTMDT